MLIERLKKAFGQKDISEMKRISNEAIEKAAFAEDPNLVDISLVAYALYKLCSKPHFLASDGWPKFYKNVMEDLDEAIKMSRDKKDLRGILEKDIIDDISEIDKSYSNYVRDIIQKARLKQASHIYALGFSIGKAAELTGADKSELYTYVGKTKIHDREFTRSKSVLDRYTRTKKILGG